MIGEPISHIDFWDVGQADCTVLNFTDGSVSIIDTGRRGSPLVDWLAERSLEIHSISLTHNDSDHAGALGSLVAAHSSRIRQIYLLRDRPIKDKKFQTLFRRAFAWEEQKHGTLQELRTGMTIWENGATKLTVVHPSLSQSVLAKSPNATSAILVLQHNYSKYTTQFQLFRGFSHKVDCWHN